MTLRDHWLPAGYDPHIERRVAGTAPGPWERLDVPDTTRCPRDSDWCTGDNCEALGRPDCPNSDAARLDVPDTPNAATR